MLSNLNSTTLILKPTHHKDKSVLAIDWPPRNANFLPFINADVYFKFPGNAAGQGFEPRLMDSESIVLPLDDPAALPTKFSFKILRSKSKPQSQKRAKSFP